MIGVRKTEDFAHWLDGLRDLRARARVQVRIARLAADLVGDAKPVGEGVSELRIDYGPGYRVYFTRRGEALLLAELIYYQQCGDAAPPHCYMICQSFAAQQ